MDFLPSKRKEYVSKYCFMNLPAGIYEAFSDGQNDNKHFQSAGAKEIVRLVFEGMKILEE